MTLRFRILSPVASQKCATGTFLPPASFRIATSVLQLLRTLPPPTSDMPLACCSSKREATPPPPTEAPPLSGEARGLAAVPAGEVHTGLPRKAPPFRGSEIDALFLALPEREGKGTTSEVVSEVWNPSAPSGVTLPVAYYSPFRGGKVLTQGIKTEY